MTDERHYRELSDEQLEDLVRGLPPRAPVADLRSRILAAAAAPQKRPSGRRGPALAVAALALLVVADILVLRFQGGPPSIGYPRSAVTQAPPEQVALLREFGPVDVSLRLAALTTAPSANGLALRARLLTELGGG